ncbi:MAG: hypothetical protein C4K58_04470 [Flavobacteriaceae bacterium]|nr:MAG: hypothetical protein C4K58_04470 [Flavobacteriaceae bacterium]
MGWPVLKIYHIKKKTLKCAPKLLNFSSFLGKAYNFRQNPKSFEYLYLFKFKHVDGISLLLNKIYAFIGE